MSRFKRERGWRMIVALVVQFLYANTVRVQMHTSRMPFTTRTELAYDSAHGRAPNTTQTELAYDSAHVCAPNTTPTQLAYDLAHGCAPNTTRTELAYDSVFCEANILSDL